MSELILRDAKKAGLLSCLFYFTSLCAFSQNLKNEQEWLFDAELIQAYELTLRFDFEQSREITNKYNNHFGAVYLEHLNDAIQLFLTEDEQQFEAFEQAIDDRISIISEGSENPHKLYYLSEMKLHQTFLQLKFGQELSAAWSFRQSYRSTEQNIALYPDFTLNDKTRGIQQIIIGSAPQRHQWLLRLLGFEGSVDEGLLKLEQFSKDASFRKLENDVATTFIYSHMMQNMEKSLEIISAYKNMVTSHRLINFTFASVLSKFSQSEEAYQILSSFDAPSFPFPFTYYMEANLLLQRGDYSLAAEKFIHFQNEYRGFNYLKDACYKAGIAFLLSDQTEKANQWFDTARNIKIAVTEGDKYANQALNSVLPDSRLIQVRLFTDGGYYIKAEELLQNIQSDSLNNPRDKIEYKYRYARLLHQTSRSEQAIAFYLDTIDLTYTDQWYFAPNAALQLGYIYLDKNQLETAKSYFEKCLTYNNHPYQNSIDNKAKAGLSRVKGLD